MISVIIPVYNQEQYLSEAIESVLTQTVKPHEIIVINDGSTDHSKEVAESYPVKVINQENKGLATARNIAIKEATGEYILPLDADDILLENCIERIESVIQQKKYDVIAPSFCMFGKFNEPVILGDKPSLYEMLQANRLAYFSAVKKSVLEEVGGYNPNMKLGYEDWNLWLDIFKRGHSLFVIQEVLALYRTKDESMLTVAQQHHGELVAQMKLNHPELYEKS